MMKVYRVENKELRVGPYQVGDFQEVFPHRYSHGHPVFYEPIEDNIFSNPVYGFNSQYQAKNWFGVFPEKETIEYLHYYSNVLAVYKVFDPKNNIVVDDKDTQCVFNLDCSKHIKDLDVSVLWE